MKHEEACEIVKEIEDTYATAFTSKDAAKLTALFTEDATTLTEWGEIVQGRSEFEQKINKAFHSMTCELQVKFMLQYVKAITNDVIISHGRAEVSGACPSTMHVAYTRVFLRQSDEWKLQSVQVAELSTKSNPMTND